MSFKILLGVTGSISAYKAPNLIRLLIKSGISVQVIATKSALDFVTETTLRTVSENPVLIEMSSDWDNIPHLSSTESADLFIIAPASANTIAKCAAGLADCLLTASFLSFTGQKLIVPAMHSEMYQNSITQKNVATLKQHGVHFLGPDTGDLACGDYGVGRMVDEQHIVDTVQTYTLPTLNLTNKHVVISAGGTSEDIDSVRTISNHSSGKLGHHLAKTAAIYGAKVTLVTSKETLSLPNITCIQAKSSQDMQNELNQSTQNCDALFMAAAISDFTPQHSNTKLKREDTLTLKLDSTPDILAKLSQNKKDTQTFVGFCLENNSNLLENAKEKLIKKKLDYIIANTPDNIGKNTRSFHILAKDTSPKYHENLNLTETAHQLLQLIPT